MAFVEQEVRYLDEDMRKATPAAQYTYVDVTFGSANADHDIVHALRPADPDALDYQVVRADRATSIYHDTSASRKRWGKGYVILRSSVANAVVRILLTIERP